MNDENKELFGQIVYPIAFEYYSDHAPKLTGMIIDVVERLKNVEICSQILNSREILIDLV